MSYNTGIKVKFKFILKYKRQEYTKRGNGISSKYSYQNIILVKFIKKEKLVLTVRYKSS